MFPYLEIFSVGLLAGLVIGSYLFDILITRPMNLLVLKKHEHERVESFELGRRQGLEIAISKVKNYKQ